jgi:hypothetical protein
VRLRHGEVALVPPGGVRDGFGQVNARPSATVGAGSAAARRSAARMADAGVTCRSH